MNLVLGLLVLGGSGLAVWAGITDPEGGVLSGLRNAIAGEPNTKRTSATSAAFLQTIAALSGGTGGTGGTLTAGAPAGGSATGAGARAAVIAEARTWLGVPYAWGGNTKSGVDCSGLTVACYKTVGVNLPRVSAAQQLTGVGRSLETAQPADLVFFGVPAHHVGIYLGNNTILHAPRTGTVVRIEKIWGGETVTVRDVISSKRTPAGKGGKGGKGKGVPV